MPTDRADLQAAVGELRAAIGASRVKSPTLLRDVAALDFSAQVLGAAEATLVLDASHVPDMAYVAARFAFEACTDLMYLLRAVPDSNAAAARAYVAAHFALRESVGMLRTSGEAIGEDPGPIPPALRKQLEQDAIDIEPLSPGAGDLLRQALRDREAGGHWHWSGLRRGEVISAVWQADQNEELGKMLRAYSGTLALRAHPRVRLGERVHLTPRGFTIELTPRTRDPGAVSIADAACRVSALLIGEQLHDVSIASDQESAAD